MLRTARPTLSLNTTLSLSTPLKSPVSSAVPRTPLSPTPISPNPSSKRFSTMPVPTSTPSYNYINSCSAKSILKKHQHPSTTGVSVSVSGPPAQAQMQKKIQFKGTPTVHCITPIENREEYYGGYVKLSKEERRWVVRE